MRDAEEASHEPPCETSWLASLAVWCLWEGNPKTHIRTQQSIAPLPWDPQPRCRALLPVMEHPLPSHPTCGSRKVRGEVALPQRQLSFLSGLTHITIIFSLALLLYR